MRFFGRYIKSKLNVFAVLFTFAVIFTVSFTLYRLPLSAVLYPFALCLLIGAVFLAADFLRTKAKADSLKKLKNITKEMLDELPDASCIAEEEYKNLVALLCENVSRLNETGFAKYNGMIDYYTVWVHQIKTPIASMRITLENNDSSLARKLKNDLNRIEGYTEMVLTYLRLDSENTDYLIRQCSLDSITKQAVKRFSGEFIGKKLSLNYDIDESITVLTDEKWLLFVIEQVLSNALKYTDSGSISIYIEEPLTLCIKDTGIGIAKEDLPRIFENGFTGFNGRENKKATGIGLYLCKRICKNLSHTISAESVTGNGTTIRITFDERSLEIE